MVPAAVVVDGVVVFVDGAFLTFIILAVGVVVVVDVLVVSPSARYYIEYITLKYKMVLILKIYIYIFKVFCIDEHPVTT